MGCPRLVAAGVVGHGSRAKDVKLLAVAVVRPIDTLAAGTANSLYPVSVGRPSRLVGIRLVGSNIDVNPVSVTEYVVA